MNRFFVTCESCQRGYSAVFVNEPDQGYRCATIRIGITLQGHYGSEIADGTRYQLNAGFKLPEARLWCDLCVEDLLSTGAISEVVEEAVVTDDDDAAQGTIIACLQTDAQ
ncbi:hypothetical protein HOY34_18920 [Xinfangfangia sp. D13-10-4-6]|uniref:hypothetical protein n=1 Tax=Pseudogemmobacter hezensis TaxID=2737662 RepID=UPI0015565B8A|nr:hypothetical protein [Pseudogemmobacter hezensis]NPD17267.1 hypothetical protein [Pseudogemmobacter hezensis]